MTTTIETGEPHHGFTVPVDDAGYVVTVPTDDMEGMPNVVGAADLSGEVTTRFDCTNTHGETSLPAGAALACPDGVLLVTHDQGWDAALVPYPDVDDEDPYGYGNARAWVLFAPSGTDNLLAPLGARHVLLVDPRTAEARALELDADVALFGVAADRDGRLVVLATDGVVRVVDPADGTVLGAVAATGGFTEGDPEQPYRRLVVADDHAYVSDPDAGAIVEVALDEPAVTRTIDVGVAPGYLGVAGD